LGGQQVQAKSVQTDPNWPNLASGPMYHNGSAGFRGKHAPNALTSRFHGD